MDSSDLKCVVCKENVETYCMDCTSPFYCKRCTESHSRMAASRNHRTINLLSGEMRNLKDQSDLHCDVCKDGNSVSLASYLCPVCQELQCQKCYLIHSNVKLTKPHQVIELSRDGQTTTTTTTTTEATSKMADKVQKVSVDDGQFASDFEGSLHITGATSVDFTVTQAPLSVLSSGAVTEDKVAGASNVTALSVTNMSYVGEFDVELDSDSYVCRITDITCLSDGRVVVCDHYNGVKVYNADCKYLYSVQCSGDLYGITVVSSYTVVVLESYRTLRYLQLDTQSGIRLDKHIDISPDAYAVSYAVRTFAVLYSEFDPREVVMIDDSGVKLTVVKLTQIKGRIPLAILLDSSGTRFYICDRDNHRVWCYRCQPGHTGVLWECSVSPKPCSVVHVGDSLVVVCQNKVHKINTSGQYLQEVVVRGHNFDISNPVAAFITICRKLVVASHWTGNRKVQIFQL